MVPVPGYRGVYTDKVKFFQEIKATAGATQGQEKRKEKQHLPSLHALCISLHIAVCSAVLLFVKLLFREELKPLTA